MNDSRSAHPAGQQLPHAAGPHVEPAHGTGQLPGRVAREALADHRSLRAQIHLELDNATNAVIYDIPNLTRSSGDFGLVINQISTLQNLQIGFRLIF